MSQNTKYSFQFTLVTAHGFNINHHKGHQIMFHINISSEYCIQVYLTIVSVLMENLGDFRKLYDLKSFGPNYYYNV